MDLFSDLKNLYTDNETKIQNPLERASDTCYLLPINLMRKNVFGQNSGLTLNTENSGHVTE